MEEPDVCRKRDALPLYKGHNGNSLLIDITVHGTVGKRFAVFAEAISWCNGLLWFPSFVLEILESCWLGVRGMQKKLAPQASKPIESVVISFHTTMQMQ